MSKYDYDAYKIHKNHIEELIKDFEDWSEFTSSSVKYDFTRFSMYFSDVSSADEIVQTLRGSRFTIAETRSRLLRIFEALQALEKEFLDEVNHAE